jgi:hypothetical protein
MSPSWKARCRWWAAKYGTGSILPSFRPNASEVARQPPRIQHCSPGRPVFPVPVTTILARRHFGRRVLAGAHFSRARVVCFSMRHPSNFHAQAQRPGFSPREPLCDERRSDYRLPLLMWRSSVTASHTRPGSLSPPRLPLAPAAPSRTPPGPIVVSIDGSVPRGPHRHRRSHFDYQRGGQPSPLCTTGAPNPVVLHNVSATPNKARDAHAVTLN